MTKFSIFDIARQAGFIQLDGMTFPGCAVRPEVLERFASMISEHEREACAKLCDKIDDDRWPNDPWPEASLCAIAIRKRGDKTKLPPLPIDQSAQSM